MGGRGHVADQVQKGAAADADHVGMPVDAQFHQPALQPRQQRRVILDLFAAGYLLGMCHEFHRVGMHTRVAGDVVPQRGE